ncbi:MAG: UvrD-helicase domain-containing protein [Verrucomicrobiota bacterium]
MDIHFHCEKCQQRLVVEEAGAGVQVQCPNCGQQLTVPVSKPASPQAADFLEQLNPSQREAVTTLDGPVLVIAGAGSGKTRVIEYRVLNLVRQNVPPNQILLITFTRRAARQMLSRTARHDPRCNSVDGGTYHAVAHRYLRIYGPSISLPRSFTVLDQADAQELTGRCAARLGHYDKTKRFPKRDTLHKIISATTNRNKNVGDVLNADYPIFLDYVEDIEKIKEAYTKTKLEQDCLDYDDLLLYFVVLLRNEALRNEVARRYRYVMADEYQDTNHLQAEITLLLAKEHQNVMVVGDDAQTIYSFRGSNHANIMSFPSLWANCKVVKLEENYRSTQTILDLANAVLDNMQNRYQKCLRCAKGLKGDKPTLRIFKDDIEEAEWIADEIKRFRDEGTAFHHQGVLARAVFLLRPMELALAARKIPYEVYGGYRLSETAHVKDLVAYLKIICNPKDELAWNRALKLIKGIGEKKADEIADKFTSCSNLVESCDRLRSFATGGKSFSAGLGELEKVLRKAATLANDLKACFDEVLKYYERLGPTIYDDWHDRWGDLQAVQGILSAYPSLDDFLTEMALEPPRAADRRAMSGNNDDEAPVVLSTIHSAKGLEWENVFLVGTREGCLPMARSADTPEDLEEEHRLLYVAVTRAQTRLFLTMRLYSDESGLMYKLSRFLDAPNVRPLMIEQLSPSASSIQIPQYGEGAANRPVLSKDEVLKQLLEFQARRASDNTSGSPFSQAQSPPTNTLDDPKIRKALDAFRASISQKKTE